MQIKQVTLKLFAKTAALFLGVVAFVPSNGFGQTSDSDGLPNTPSNQQPLIQSSISAEGENSRYVLVEDFTAHSLRAREFKLGTDVEYGLSNTLMLGTDVVSDTIGAPNIQAKMQVWSTSRNAVAIGLRAAYLTDKTLLWGSVRDHFSELEAKAIRPSISWTHSLSDRLKLHSFWGVGLGNVHAKLSENGRRKLWASKHGDTIFPEDRAANAGNEGDSTQPISSAEDVNTSQNQEKGSEDSAIAQRTAQVQSVTGLAQDRFQITGEIVRRSGHKVLITTRIERTDVEDLQTKTFRLTAAHQWIGDKFQIRLGGGFQYMVMEGRDLDGEKIDISGWWPATDVVFYWRL